MTHSRIPAPRPLVILLLLCAAGCDRFDTSTSIGGDIASDIDPTISDSSAVLSTIRGCAIVTEAGSARDTVTDSVSSSLPVGYWRGERSLVYVGFDSLLVFSHRYEIDSVRLSLLPNYGSDTVDQEEFRVVVGRTDTREKDELIDESTIDSVATVVFDTTSSMKDYDDLTLTFDTSWGWYSHYDSIRAIPPDTADTSSGTDTTFDTVGTAVDLRDLAIALAPAAGQDSILRLSRPYLRVWYYGPVDGANPGSDSLVVRPHAVYQSVQEDNAVERDSQPLSSRAPRRYLTASLSLADLLAQAQENADPQDFATVVAANLSVPIRKRVFEDPGSLTLTANSTDTTWHDPPDPLSLIFTLTTSDTKPEDETSMLATFRIDSVVDSPGDTVAFARFNVQPDFDELWNGGDLLTEDIVHFYVRALDIGGFQQVYWDIAPGDSLQAEFVLSNPQ